MATHARPGRFRARRIGARGHVAWAAIALAGGIVACSSIDQRQLEVRRDAAQTYYDTGDLVRAENSARQALQVDPSDLKTLTILGMTRTRAGWHGDLVALDDAIATFEKAEGEGGKKTFQVQLGHGMARGARAREYLRRAESLEPTAPTTAGFGAEPGAPDTGEQRGTPAERALWAKRYRDGAAVDLDIAEERLLAAHESQPAYPDVLEHLQSLYSLRNDPDRSLEWGRKAVELAEAGRKEKKKILERTGRSGALEDAARADVRRFDVREANSRSLMALMLWRKGDAATAATELDRVLALEPDRVEDYYNRAICRQTAGAFADARHDLETFLRRSTLPPSAPMVRDAWNRIAECDRAAPTPAPDAHASTR